jgi:hypothetical protein
MPIWAWLIATLIAVLIVLVCVTLYFEVRRDTNNFKPLLDPGPNRYERRAAADVLRKKMKRHKLFYELDPGLEGADVRMITTNLTLADYPGKVYWKGVCVYMPPAPPKPLEPVVGPPPPGPGSSVPPRQSTA